MANYIIQLKRGKSTSWTNLNLILQAGEPGFEIDTGKLKIGDGVTPWNELSYLGENKSLIVNADTRNDFPPIGDVNNIYKSSQEKTLYQWNQDTYKYELLFENTFITAKELQDAIDNIKIPEISLEDYAKKADVQELFNSIIPLNREEIFEVCN